eukprot:2890347-Rhodomonas_salina.3
MPLVPAMPRRYRRCRAATPRERVPGFRGGRPPRRRARRRGHGRRHGGYRVGQNTYTEVSLPEADPAWHSAGESQRAAQPPGSRPRVHGTSCGGQL